MSPSHSSFFGLFRFLVLKIRCHLISAIRFKIGKWSLNYLTRIHFSWMPPSTAVAISGGEGGVSAQEGYLPIEDVSARRMSALGVSAQEGWGVCPGGFLPDKHPPLAATTLQTVIISFHTLYSRRHGIYIWFTTAAVLDESGKTAWFPGNWYLSTLLEGHSFPTVP